MSEYFSKVRDPQGLLQRERAAVTGRRVPKSRSKRSDDTSGPRLRRFSVPTAAIVGGIVAALVVIGGVVFAMSRGGDDSGAAVDSTTPVTVLIAPDVSLLQPVDSTAPVVTTAVSTTTTELVTTTTTVPGVTTIHLTSLAAATSGDVIPVDPGATATFNGPLPAFRMGVDCTVDGCAFSLRTFAPGTVNDAGLTTIPAVAGRFVSTSSKSVSCTGSNGTRFTRKISSTIDLSLTGSQTVNGVVVPTQIGGTLTSVFPEAGYVPHVGDVVDQGAETGCAGQTIILTVAGDLAPTP